MRVWIACVILALGACASTPVEEARPFDPAACYEREFDVYFEEFDEGLSGPARAAVAAVTSSLSGCRVEHVRIVGLAGARGDARDNLDLSYRRAEALADHLARVAGWPRASFELLAAGESGATTEEGLNRPMRRRAHVTVRAVAP